MKNVQIILTRKREQKNSARHWCSCPFMRFFVFSFCHWLIGHISIDHMTVTKYATLVDDNGLFTIYKFWKLVRHISMWRNFTYLKLFWQAFMFTVLRCHFSLVLLLKYIFTCWWLDWFFFCISDICSVPFLFCFDMSSLSLLVLFFTYMLLYICIITF